jgi:hypothetical protein
MYGKYSMLLKILAFALYTSHLSVQALQSDHVYLTYVVQQRLVLNIQLRHGPHRKHLSQQIFYSCITLIKGTDRVENIASHSYSTVAYYTAVT